MQFVPAQNKFLVNILTWGLKSNQCFNFQETWRNKPVEIKHTYTVSWAHSWVVSSILSKKEGKEYARRASIWERQEH